MDRSSSTAVRGIETCAWIIHKETKVTQLALQLRVPGDVPMLTKSGGVEEVTRRLRASTAGLPHSLDSRLAG